MNKILFKIWKGVISGIIVLLSIFVVIFHLAWAWVYLDPEPEIKKDHFIKYPASVLLFCCPTAINMRVVDPDGNPKSGKDVTYKTTGLSNPGTFDPTSFETKMSENGKPKTVTSKSSGEADVTYYAGEEAGDVTITAVVSDANPPVGSRTITIKDGTGCPATTSTLNQALIVEEFTGTVRCNGKDGYTTDRISLHDGNIGKYIKKIANLYSLPYTDGDIKEVVKFQKICTSFHENRHVVDMNVQSPNECVGCACNRVPVVPNSACPQLARKALRDEVKCLNSQETDVINTYGGTGTAVYKMHEKLRFDIEYRLTYGVDLGC